MGKIREKFLLKSLTLTGSKIEKCSKQIKYLSKLSTEELKKFQLEKLSKMLYFALEHVPYYRNLIKKNHVIDKTGNLDWDNFLAFPALTKEIISHNYESLISDVSKRGRKGWKVNSSGGSTGTPVSVLQDENYRAWNVANTIFYKSFGGQHIGDRELRLWGSEHDLLEGKERLSTRIRNFVYGRREMNTFTMTPENMRIYIDRWNQYRPLWVEAYTQSMYEFAVFVRKIGISMFKPRGIVTSAGTLYPSMRKTIEDTFGCPVFNRYGSREVGSVACNCINDTDLHLSVWNHYVEVLDSSMNPVSSGEKGFVYITTLNNFAMPLIRYYIGDIASAVEWDHACPDYHMPLLTGLEGREMSVVRTRNGKIIPGEFFIHFVGVVYNTGGIDKFQVIQEEYELLKIKVRVRNINAFEKEKQHIEEAIRLEMDNDVNIVWQYVEDIPPLKSGKYLYVSSRISF
jgi:phenylacetate-CoA ligase